MTFTPSPSSLWPMTRLGAPYVEGKRWKYHHGQSIHQAYVTKRPTILLKKAPNSRASLSRGDRPKASFGQECAFVSTMAGPGTTTTLHFLETGMSPTMAGGSKIARPSGKRKITEDLWAGSRTFKEPNFRRPPGCRASFGSGWGVGLSVKERQSSKYSKTP